MSTARLAIIGTVGVPNVYGGFEALAENLVKDQRFDALVICSSKNYSHRLKRFHSARLIYLPFSANGVSSVVYDIVSSIIAIALGYRNLLILGVSGAIFFPFLRIFCPWTNLYVNVDGIEHQRQKFNRFASLFLRLSEWFAVNCSHHIISDNLAVKKYLEVTHNKKSTVIAYGGDHALGPPEARFLVTARNGDDASKLADINNNYFFGISRIEPENNIHLILEAFAESRFNLVFVGNWQYSEYGRQLSSKYGLLDWITLLDPVYDLSILYVLRSQSCGYIHGHSAGGTNPSLVEALFFQVPILAFDCSYNKATLQGTGLFFSDTVSLKQRTNLVNAGKVSIPDYSVLRRIYTWENICNKYFELFCSMDDPCND